MTLWRMIGVGNPGAGIVEAADVEVDVVDDVDVVLVAVSSADSGSPFGGMKNSL